MFWFANDNWIADHYAHLQCVTHGAPVSENTAAVSSVHESEEAEN
jgi:hypothetical protein